MKKAAFAAIALLAAGAVRAGAIDDMLGARLAESPLHYAEAAAAVAAESKEGSILASYALAVVSDEPDAPPAAAMDAEARAETLKNARRIVSAIAKDVQNPDWRIAKCLLTLEKKVGSGPSALKAAADTDYPPALVGYGTHLLSPLMRPGAKMSRWIYPKAREGFGCFGRAAAQNDPNGYYCLAVCYLQGWGCGKDVAQALANLNKAALQSHPKALNLLGEKMLETGGDPVVAVRNFAQSAALGNARGKYLYAKALHEGTGVATNDVLAARLLEESAAKRLPEAMYSLGRVLYRSDDTNSQARAVSLWRECASLHGHPQSIDALGEALLEGRGTEKDERAAVFCFNTAAGAGDPGAMLHLAACFETGAGGLKKSHWNANWWRVKSNAAKGDRNAKVWLASHRLE